MLKNNCNYCLISIYNIWFAQDLKWTCAYISEYNQCKSAIKKWTSRTIEDFILCKF